MRERHVVIVAFEGVQPLDAVGPHEVFAGARRAAASLGKAGGYRVTLASTGGGTVRAESGLVLGTETLPGDDDRIDTLVLAGGSGANAAAADEELLAWIRRTAPDCRRVATVCSGTFIAAAAGLLDGRRVTTHWARAQELSEAHPRLTVDPDPIYIRDGKVWSSAGVTAGMDLSLALVEDDLGVDVAQIVARAGSSCSCTDRAGRANSPHPSGCHEPSAPPSAPSRTSSRPRRAATTACRTWPPRRR